MTQVCDQADPDSVVKLLLRRLDEEGLDNLRSSYLKYTLAATVGGLALQRSEGRIKGTRL